MWREGHVAVAVAVAVLLLGEGCFRPGVYACSSEGSCDAGFCEPVGYCSHPDEACPSGRRYSELAGEGLASTCVADTVAGTSADASDTGSLSETTTLDETSMPDPVCGNGVLEPGEECDDGNDMPGDGCSEECVLSGTVLWEVTRAGDLGGQALALAIVAPGDVVVAGSLHTAPAEHVASYGRFALEDGAEIWSEVHDGDDPSDIAVAVVVNLSNDIIVAGRRGTETQTAASWLRRIRPSGESVWTVEPAIRVIHGLTPNGGGVIAVGHGVFPDDTSSGGIAVAVRETDGEQQWLRTWEPSSRLRAVAGFSHNAYYVAAAIDGDIALLRGTNTTLIEEDRYSGVFGGMDEPQAVAVVGLPFTVALAGYTTTVDGFDWWLRVYDEGPVERWTRSGTALPLPLADEIEGVAVGPDGGIYVTGLLTRDDKDIWVAKFAPGGDEVWSRILPEQNVGEDIGRAVAIAPDGSLVVAGELGSGPGRREFWLARLVP